ncbi:hypothetical protein [Pedobacter sp. GR22-6]|uniref:hypothetical protein n=1 Tax=Pedobacter sp. GR22-6 TaxID=3127957 RepID=UPI00307E6D43
MTEDKSNLVYTEHIKDPIYFFKIFNWLNFFVDSADELCGMENIKTKTVVTIPETVQGTGPVLMLNMLKFADRRLYMEEYLPPS